MVTPKDPSAVCLEDEILAAFADGRLDGARRAAVVEHVASCERCYELVAETLQTLEPEAGVAPVRTQAPVRRAWWLAAAAVLAGIGFATWRTQTARALPSLDDLTGALQVDAAVTETLWTGGVTRGAAPGSGDPAGSFRFGVQLVDLRASVAAGRPEVVRQQLLLAAGRLHGVAFMDEQERLLRSAADTVGQPGALARLADTLTTLEPAWRERFDPTFVSFGAWTESGRLAALHGRAAYFARSDVRGVPAAVRAKAGETLPADAAEALTAIERSWPDGATGPSIEVSKRFERLLRVFE